MKIKEKKIKWNLTKEQIINEILYYYHSTDIEKKFNINIFECNDIDLLTIFDLIVKENCLTVEAQNIISTYNNNKILIDTPDGFQEISDLYLKENLDCYKIETQNYSASVSYNHLFETNVDGNWVKAIDIKIDDKILTKTGFESVINNTFIGNSNVYDWTVEHDNHRYWAGNGLSSHNTGKSFLCYNICKQAQQDGYSIIYIDTEFAIELDQLPGYGIDISEDKFMLMRTNIIEDLKIFTTQLLDSLKEQKNSGKEIEKIMIVLDSVGQLGSRKEVEDALSGREKADMTKAKALASYFRIINQDLGYLSIPMICTNHTYKSMDLFPKDIMKGGNSLFYSASTIAFLTKAKLKDGAEDDLDLGQSGLVVTAKMMKNRMAKPKKVKFEISFVSGCNPFVGLDYWCTDENFKTVGVAKGKMVDDVFVPGGVRWYVSHLGKHVKTSELFSERVFTKEVLDALRPIIKDYFRYKSITEINEIEKQLIEAKGEIDEEDMFTDEMSTSNLFDED